MVKHDTQTKETYVINCNSRHGRSFLVGGACWIRTNGPVYHQTLS